MSLPWFKSASWRLQSPRRKTRPAIRRTLPRPKPFRPLLESLEDRLVPAGLLGAKASVGAVDLLQFDIPGNGGGGPPAAEVDVRLGELSLTITLGSLGGAVQPPTPGPSPAPGGTQ